MATWQFDIYALPASVLEECLGGVPDKLDDWDLIESLWPDAPQPVGLASELTAFGPLWSDLCGCESWGTEDGHCVHVMSDERGVCEVLIRIDMHDFSDWIVERLTRIARRYEWVALTVEGQVLEFGTPDFRRAALDSGAAEFVRDPRAFLDRTHDEGLDQYEQDTAPP